MGTTSKKEQSLTEAFAELEGLTEEFEKGEVDIENGVPKFKRGLELAKKLKGKLTEIENEIEEIKTEFKDSDEAEVEAEEPEPDSESEIPL